MKLFYSNKKTLGNQNGFTMIEILIAVSIFAIGMLAVASMQISGIHGNATAGSLTGAATWAADRMETLLGLPYDHADLDPAGNPHSGGTQGRYTIEWNVIADEILPNTKTIRVSVEYSDRGRNKTVSFNYYKADI